MSTERDRERQQEAWQSMYEYIRDQSIHSAPPATATEGGEVPAATDGAPAPAPAAAFVHTPRERDYGDSEAQKAMARLWLVSFCDLMSLMLCFFVMMYAMREPDMTRISRLVGGGAGTYEGEAVTPKGEAGGDQEGASIAHVEYGEALNLDYLQGVLKNALGQAKLEDDVRILPGRDHLKLAVADPFTSGGALSAGGERIAKGLAERLNFLSNRITVVAHGGRWDEVMARSRVFGEMMRDGGYRKSFTVLGVLSRGPDIEIRVEADDGQLR